jgi:hypothetical protein
VAYLPRAATFNVSHAAPKTTSVVLGGQVLLFGTNFTRTDEESCAFGPVRTSVYSTPFHGGECAVLPIVTCQCVNIALTSVARWLQACS